MSITLQRGKKITEIPYEEYMTLQSVAQTMQEHYKNPIYVGKVDGIYQNLKYYLNDGDVIHLYGIENAYANMTYQLSLIFLYGVAVHQVLGDHIRVQIANSLSKGLFTTLHGKTISQEDLDKVDQKMREIVANDLPIVEKYAHRDVMLRKLQKSKNLEAKNLFETAYDLNGCYECTLCNETHIFYQHLVPSTRYLKYFELKKYRNGVLLRFPSTADGNVIQPYLEQQLLYDAFKEETNWQHLLKVHKSSQLNEKILARDTQNMVLLSEALHERRIGEIASQIKDKQKRIILISGPSSSGKTSFAKRLCIQLQVLGLNPLYLGTDDYFTDRSELVPDENGEIDYESIEVVDTDLFSEQMNALLAGEKVDIPEFDFLDGKKIFGKRIQSIEDDQPIVIEGIHGLNPKLTEGIPDDQKFKIYISPLTSLNIDSYHRVPTTDARMLRRIVRDNRTRGKSAADTILDWPSVRHGEDHYIFPYNDQADVFFNSQSVYELALLKKYAEPLLKEIPYTSAAYAEASRMLQFLKYFVVLEDESALPPYAILREFIGGSILVK